MEEKMKMNNETMERLRQKIQDILILINKNSYDDECNKKLQNEFLKACKEYFHRIGR